MEEIKENKENRLESLVKKLKSKMKKMKKSILTTTKEFPVSISEVLGFAGLGSLVFTILKNYSDSIHTCVEISLLVFFLLTFILIIHRLWNAKENSFKFLDSDHGEAADSPVKAATHSIKTTHFTGIVPYSPYQELLKVKMNSGVRVKRIVCYDSDKDDDKHLWLEGFKDSRKYEQIDIFEPFPLPLDIMIFDEKSVVLHLPSEVDGDDFHSAILIENDKVAHLFENLFARIEMRAKIAKATKQKMFENVPNS